MTYTVNGIGTHLSGVRELEEDEIKKWEELLPYSPRRTVHDYRIATESLVFVFLPVIPLKTFVFHFTGNDQYLIDFFPTGKESVYWDHVFGSPIFFISPAILLLIIFFSIFPL